MRDEINLFVEKLHEMPHFNKVKFVFLFGSVSEGSEGGFSDVDFAVYYDGNDRARFKFRMRLLGALYDYFDVQIFQDLPLYVRINVLKGKLIYCNDLAFAYEIVYQTIRDFDDFKERYYDYLNARRTKHVKR